MTILSRATLAALLLGTAATLAEVTLVDPDGYMITLKDGETYTLSPDIPIPPDPNTPPDPNEPPPVGAADGIVYTRVPRTQGPVTVTHFQTGEERVVKYPDVWDRLPDTGNLVGGFRAPGQLVYRESDGTETIIYDCMASTCLPFDASVSLDGTKIAFSVYFADKLVNPRSEGYYLPQTQFEKVAAGAQIFIYDIASGQTTSWPYTPGVMDVSPAWLPDDRMLFASNREAYAPPYSGARNPGYDPPTPRLYIADNDGTNVVDITPHEVAGASHPYLLDSGKVVYSSHWRAHNLPFYKTNSNVQGMATRANLWVVSSIDQEGGDFTVIFGGHRNKFEYIEPPGFPKVNDLKALHYLGQRNNGHICAANYYRANNLGTGDVLCWPPQAPGLEGPAPDFMPDGLYSVAGWTTSNDKASRMMGDGTINHFLGKLGWPDAAPDGGLIVTFAQGYCTQNQAAMSKNQPQVDASRDKVGCDAGVYQTTVIPSALPTDLKVIVDRPEWHEFAARSVRPRQIAVAAPRKSASGLCEIVNTDAGQSDARAFQKYRFNFNYFTTANNGGEIQGLPHSDVKAVRFYAVKPIPWPRNGDVAGYSSLGNTTQLLGDVPLLADGSFRVALPCDLPYVMAGVDNLGHAIKRDQFPQSLRKGEERVCKGCHLHGEVGRSYDDSLAATAPAVILDTLTELPKYTADVKPILEARCKSCHASDVPLFDYNLLVWDFMQGAVPPSSRVVTDRGYGLQRPYTSKYVNTMYARESLLYWKAVGIGRMDGRTDDTYPDDIDYGADHPTDITPAEAKVIAAWLDSGAPE